MDDYYQLSTGLVVTETTIVNNNESLWSELTPHSLLDWARNMVANRLATNGAKWAQLFSKYNSGTYNNQVTTTTYYSRNPVTLHPENLSQLIFQLINTAPSLSSWTILASHHMRLWRTAY